MAACVTRILELRGFDPKLKTRDIQAAFAEFEFKIKWIDDTSLYLVFPDALITKQVFLHTLGSMPSQLLPAQGQTVTLRPYTGPDGQAIIAHTQRPPRNEHANNRSRSISAAQNFVDPSHVSVGPVSPAVSMMLLAAAVAGPPGSTLYANGAHSHSSLSNGLSNGAHPTGRRGSQNGFQPSLSQASALDGFAYGLGNFPSAYGMDGSGISPSSSWASNVATPQGFQPGHGVSVSRSALEGIAEASSREELPNRTPQKSSSELVVPETAIVITASTPLLDLGAETALGSGISSPMGKTKSDNAQSGGPWLSREPSPTPSLPTLNKQPSLKNLVDSMAATNINGNGTQSSSPYSGPVSGEESDSADGFRTPPENGAPAPNVKPTPPRIGNSGKRMLGHALGIRHPALPPRVIPSVGATN